MMREGEDTNSAAKLLGALIKKLTPSLESTMYMFPDTVGNTPPKNIKHMNTNIMITYKKE